MSQQLSRQDRIIPDHIDRFLLDQFDRAGIGHQVFAEKASALLVRSVRLRHVVYLSGSFITPTLGTGG